MIFPNASHNYGPCKLGNNPTDLLDACLFWTGKQGGTVHQFLPYLFWKKNKKTNFHDRMPYWTLWLGDPDNLRESTDLGWIACLKKDLPRIEPSMRIYWNRKIYPIVDEVTA